MVVLRSSLKDAYIASLVYISGGVYKCIVYVVKSLDDHFFPALFRSTDQN